MATYDYDLIVIGGGAGGLSVTSGAAQLGVKVLLIDQNELGGDCLHYGCVPSKTLIKSAKVAHIFQQAEKYGLKKTKPSFDFPEITKRIKAVQKVVAEHDDPERFRKLGADVVFGQATFVDSHTIQIELNKYLANLQQPPFAEGTEKQLISGKKIVIATGSRPFIPPLDGLEDAGYITNESVFDLKRKPESLLVIGAGPIGCEIGQSFARLGTKVHLIYRKEHIMDKEDTDVAKVIEKQFLADGLNLISQSQIKSLQKKNHQKLVVYEQNGQEKTLVVDQVLVSTGRLPNVELSLERASVKYSPRGIETNLKTRTNISHIYAIGDVNGKYLFTHKAGYEAGIVISNAIFHLPKKADYSKIPWSTFTDPEVASCGLNEKRAKEAGIKYEVWTHQFEKQDRALAESENEGFVKILTTGRRGKIIGAQIVGLHAGELIHEFIIALNAGLSISTIASSVHIYPTLAEISKTAAGKFFAPKLFSSFTKKILRFFFRYRGKG